MDDRGKRPSAVAAGQPPEQITLVYRPIGDAHTFTAVEIPGLVIVDPDFSAAFHDGLKGVSQMMTRISGRAVCYEADFEAFKTKVQRQAKSSAAKAPVTVTGLMHSAA